MQNVALKLKIIRHLKNKFSVTYFMHHPHPPNKVFTRLYLIFSKSGFSLNTQQQTFIYSTRIAVQTFLCLVLNCVNFYLRVQASIEGACEVLSITPLESWLWKLDSLADCVTRESLPSQAPPSFTISSNSEAQQTLKFKIKHDINILILN